MIKTIEKFNVQHFKAELDAIIVEQQGLGWTFLSHSFFRGEGGYVLVASFQKPSLNNILNSLPKVTVWSKIKTWLGR